MTVFELLIANFYGPDLAMLFEDEAEAEEQARHLRKIFFLIQDPVVQREIQKFPEGCTGAWLCSITAALASELHPEIRQSMLNWIRETATPKDVKVLKRCLYTRTDRQK